MSSANLTSTLPIVLGHHDALPVREALSGIFGSISLACWLFLLLPQLLENYRNQSAEAISLGFIFIWFLGDLFNIIGSVWADLVPVVIAIGGYFCIADGVLISQVLYYGIKNRRSEGRSLLEAARETVADNTTGPSEGEDVEDTEEQPLLKRTRTASITIPGSQSPILGRRRRSTDVSTLRRRSSNAADDHLAKILEESNSQTGARLWLKNLISIFAICAIGTVGWMLAYEGGAWTPSTNDSADGGEEPIAKGAQVLGYASAALYLCARIPQIIKNYREKSCEGLSLLFFILSVMGNLTYGAGILCHSTERTYVIKNVPWLIGSLGTMVEDVTIFVQFHLYRNQEPEAQTTTATTEEDENGSAIV